MLKTVANCGPAWAILALAAALCACGQPSSADSGASAPTQAADNTGYVAPPDVSGVALGANGTAVLTGRAPPEALVRLSAPDGAAFGAAAGTDGAWRIELPPARSARMFAMAAETNGRLVPAQGALLVVPGLPPRAFLVRAGVAAVAVGAPGAGPTIASVDYDPNGYVAVGGLAPRHSMVRLLLDGRPAAVAQADALGRYAVLAPNHPLSFAGHQFVVETAANRAQAEVQLVRPVSLNTPYIAAPERNGWRVEWALSGGGVQTTFVLTPPAGGAG